MVVIVVIIAVWIIISVSTGKTIGEKIKDYFEM